MRKDIELKSYKHKIFNLGDESVNVVEQKHRPRTAEITFTTEIGQLVTKSWSKQIPKGKHF